MSLKTIIKNKAILLKIYGTESSIPKGALLRLCNADLSRKGNYFNNIATNQDKQASTINYKPLKNSN